MAVSLQGSGTSPHGQLHVDRRTSWSPWSVLAVSATSPARLATGIYPRGHPTSTSPSGETPPSSRGQQSSYVSASLSSVRGRGPASSSLVITSTLVRITVFSPASWGGGGRVDPITASPSVAAPVSYRRIDGEAGRCSGKDRRTSSCGRGSGPSDRLTRLPEAVSQGTPCDIIPRSPGGTSLTRRGG